MVGGENTAAVDADPGSSTLFFLLRRFAGLIRTCSIVLEYLVLEGRALRLPSGCEAACPPFHRPSRSHLSQAQLLYRHSLKSFPFKYKKRMETLVVLVLLRVKFDDGGETVEKEGASLTSDGHVHSPS